MSLNLNKAILAGRIVATPEIKQTQSGAIVASFRIAVNRRVSGGDHPESDFFNITAWNNTAEFVARYFDKGSAVCVCGRIQNRTWTDQNGQKRYAMDIVAEEVNFVESKATAEANAYKDPVTHPYDVAGQSHTIPDPVNLASPPPSFEVIKGDEDLPF